jgi:hypothetical protein
MLRRKQRREKLKQLYGTGLANNQPQGLVGLPGIQTVAIDPANLHPSFCAGEKLIEDQNVEMDSYGVLCSTDAKRILNSTPAFTGGGDSVWEKLRNPQSSPEIIDNRCFCGAWQLATICLYGTGIEFLIDPITLGASNQIKLMATLLCEVAFRFAGAFGITAAIT